MSEKKKKTFNNTSRHFFCTQILSHTALILVNFVLHNFFSFLISCMCITGIFNRNKYLQYPSLHTLN